MAAEYVRRSCSVTDRIDREDPGALIEPLGAGSFPGRRFHGAQAVDFRAASLRAETAAGGAGEGAGGQGALGCRG